MFAPDPGDCYCVDPVHSCGEGDCLHGNVERGEN